MSKETLNQAQLKSVFESMICPHCGSEHITLDHWVYVQYETAIFQFSIECPECDFEFYLETKSDAKNNTIQNQKL